MSDLEERVKVIENRNLRVAADKAWEVSWARRGLIAGITYICTVILLNALGSDDVWKQSLVPVAGYLLSTFSLPPLKKLWIEHKIKGLGNG